MASLRELQHSFAAALRRPGAPAVAVRGHFDVYRHNSEAVFRGVLEMSFPVVHRRVGDDYFRQLAHHFRERHPSRSGDLHWVGEGFPGFLAEHLGGTDYAWLADLAALEWAREAASIIDPAPALGAECLAGFAADELERLRFVLQPGLRLIESAYPIFTVWMSNQAETASPVDQSLGSQYVAVLPCAEGAHVLSLSGSLHLFLKALGEASLGDAMAAAHLSEADLLEALRLLFAEGLVCDVRLSA
jgi:hypothetical protein